LIGIVADPRADRRARLSGSDDLAPQAAQRRRRWRGFFRLAGLIGSALLAACGNHDDETLGTRPWGAFEVAVQTRPSPPRAGSNEVVVIISGAHHRPVYDALVFLRTQESAPWVQAIEDGHVGVYRRAVRFAPEPDAVLRVQLRRGDDTTELAFPVTLARPG
jgi:hypothetical protein